MSSRTIRTARLLTRLCVGLLLLLAGLPILAADPLPWGKFLDLPGHRIHYQCVGTGSTTVVLLPGTPRFSFDFALVMPQISQFARVCTYDRAGDAWSEPLPNQPQAQQFVDELDQFLDQISPRMPVVLGGHSIGGVLARAYYAQHPQRISAMVLIDTLPLEGTRSSDEELRAEAARQPRAKSAPKIKLAAPFTLLPPPLRPLHTWATNKWYEYAVAVDPFIALKYQADLYELARHAQSPTLPVWFLARAASATSQEAWITRQMNMAAAWPKSRLVRAVGSSHDIELDRPQLVIRGIREAVDEVSNRDRR